MKPYSEPYWRTKVKKVQHGRLLMPDAEMPIARICDLITPGIEPVFIIELEVDVVAYAKDAMNESQWEEMMKNVGQTDSDPLTITYDNAQVSAGPITLSVAVNNDGWCLVMGPTDNEHAYITGRQIGKSTYQASFFGPSVLSLPRPPALVTKCLGSPDPDVLKKAIAADLEAQHEDRRNE